jgi:GNAT superfamily N-acetyltransferase
MKIQPTTRENIPRIMEIVKDAQRYLASLNIDQWQDNYPNVLQIEMDIKNKDSYVILDEKCDIIGTTVFSTKTDPNYNKIKGAWLTTENAEYGVIHRLAVSDLARKKGMGKFVLNSCEGLLKTSNIGSMRIDTHEDNHGMQHLLKQMGYEYCGVVHLEDGAERLAYEKLII